LLRLGASVSGGFLLYDFLAVVRTAVLANAVSQHILLALRAYNDAGQAELGIVGTSLVSASRRHFLLRYCHGIPTPP
jgi:hypothetical protein